MSKLGLALVILITVIVLFFVTSVLINNKAISNEEAIAIIKQQYPDLRTFPSDNLPPKSIQSDKDSNGWYITFIQEGSGLPILGARCFFVDNSQRVNVIGRYQNNGEFVTKISPQTCQK